MYLKLRCDATGLNKSVDFFKSDSVIKLREKAAEVTNIDVEKVRLIVAGKVLVDKRDDGTDTQIYLDFNLKGGEVVMIFKQEKLIVSVDMSPSVNKENVKEPKQPERKIKLAEKKEEVPSSSMSTEPVKKEKKPRNEENEKSIEPPAADGEGWFVCAKCMKNPERKCEVCNCRVCGINKDSDKTLICDGYDATGACQAPFHFDCLTGKYKLEEMPEGDWYCPECQEEAEERVEKTILPGKGVKLSAKKANSAAARATRAWGRGVSCSGVDNKNTDVPTDYRGPIPGVQVGQTWQYRLQLSSSGVHRPPVGGIHASEAKGAFSIVMSGGYGDDEDKGEEVIYTGSGGRDLGGNKRVNRQSFDQVLKKANYGLAASCYPFKVNAEGDDAGDEWRKSGPIRVTRGTNKPQKKVEPFMPEKGFRYDGIYKVVKYYKVKGQEGFYVWKYLMRRDDDTPAPWTKEGKARIERLGLKMIMGPQHEEGVKERKGGQQDDPDAQSTSDTKPEHKRKSSKKRGIDEDDEKGKKKSTAKRAKKQTWELPTVVLDSLVADKKNESRWQMCVEAAMQGRAEFLKAVEDNFSCIVCMDLYKEPVTLACGHGLCLSCLERSQKASEVVDMNKCPTCRQPIDALDVEVNEQLQLALKLVYDTKLV